MAEYFPELYSHCAFSGPALTGSSAFLAICLNGRHAWSPFTLPVSQCVCSGCIVAHMPTHKLRLAGSLPEEQGMHFCSGNHPVPFL